MEGNNLTSPSCSQVGFPKLVMEAEITLFLILQLRFCLNIQKIFLQIVTNFVEYLKYITRLLKVLTPLNVMLTKLGV